MGVILNNLIPIIGSSIAMSIPLVLASVGGAFSVRSGIMALGLESMMMMGAFFGVLGSYFTGSVLFGFLLGMVGGMVIGRNTATVSATKQAVTSPLTAGCHRCVRHIKKRPYGKQTTKKKTVFHVARFRRRGALCIAGFLDSPEFDKFLENIVSH